MTTSFHMYVEPGRKVLVTSTHVYFLNGPFSQWHKASFEASLGDSTEKLVWNCGEAYMMASKAHLFGDEETLQDIMDVQHEPDIAWVEVPKLQKALGRQVKGLKGGKWDADDIALWNANALQIVFRGNWAKFTQNADLAKYLIDTEDRTLVEGASYDTIWGVGLSWDDPAILDEKNWRGTNWLGKTLMRVRFWMLYEMAVGYTPFSDRRIAA